MTWTAPVGCATSSHLMMGGRVDADTRESRLLAPANPAKRFAELIVYCHLLSGEASMSTQPTAPSAAETPAHLAFYERISQKHMTPLWLSLGNLVTPEPVSACQPAAWSFADIRAAMI